MIKAKGVAHGCVATLFYFARILSSNPERHPFIRCRTHKNEENVYVSACGSSASTKFLVLPFAEAPQAPNFLFCHLRKLRKHQIFCFDLCGSSASIKTFVFTFAERRCVFGMVGAVPVCPPERPRSGVSIPKYICTSRIMHEDLTIDAPLWGDTDGHTGTAPTKLHHTHLHHSIKRHHPSTCNPPIINGHIGRVPAKSFII